MYRPDPLFLSHDYVLGFHSGIFLIVALTFVNRFPADDRCFVTLNFDLVSILLVVVVTSDWLTFDPSSSSFAEAQVGWLVGDAGRNRDHWLPENSNTKILLILHHNTCQ